MKPTQGMWAERWGQRVLMISCEPLVATMPEVKPLAAFHPLPS